MTMNLVQLHGMIMILSSMFFTSTGILFARYGRSLRFGIRRQLLGKAVWFQIHRFLLSLASLLTLLGFFFILVHAKGQWANPRNSDIRLFVHSILGVIIVCCVIIQIWLALYRCHPHSRFRFFFAWSHRVVGFLAFGLSIPTIFLIIILMSNSRPVLVPIFSCWTAWIVIVILICEKIEHQQRVAVVPMANNGRIGDTNQENGNTNPRPNTEAGTNTNTISQRHNQIKLLLLFIHVFISLALSIVLIVFLCN